MSIRSLLKEVPLSSLIDIQRHYIHLRVVIGTVPPIAIQKTVHNVLGMEIFLIRSDYGGKPRTFDRCPIESHDNPSGCNFAAMICNGEIIPIDVAFYLGQMSCPLFEGTEVVSGRSLCGPVYCPPRSSGRSIIDE
jgi:hypothetical protein